MDYDKSLSADELRQMRHHDERAKYHDEMFEHHDKMAYKEQLSSDEGSLLNFLNP